jgi:hypothetical protein
MITVAAGCWLASPASGQNWPWAGGYRPIQPPYPLTFTPGPPPLQISPAAPQPVAPVRYWDYELRSRVWSALANDPLLRLFDVRVAAHQGTVTLTGSADTWADRQRAAADARAAGASTVVNQLRVRND